MLESSSLCAATQRGNDSLIPTARSLYTAALEYQIRYLCMRELRVYIGAFCPWTHTHTHDGGIRKLSGVYREYGRISLSLAAVASAIPLAQFAPSRY